MSEHKALLHHISDTALWAAVHRAKETERPDSQFRDRFARRLAGDSGAQIAAGLEISEADSWSWMARTVLFDRFVHPHVKLGVDMVLNLGAGLDTRPYRMKLPATLEWIEVDLPDILNYKEEVLAGEKLQCKLERVRLDLADIASRRTLFQSLQKRATKALVLTEGVITYLTSGDAGVLAEDLAAIPAFQSWVLDLASPGLLRVLRERTQPQFAEAAALRFAPENGPEFFEAHGWRARDVQSLLKTAGKLNRLPVAMQPLALFPEDPARMGQHPWSGVCLLKTILNCPRHRSLTKA